MKTIKLRPGKEESLLRHHPWVFSGAIATLPSDLEEGDEVCVTDSKGNVLGTGHYQIGSIAVRILEFGVESISDDFFCRRLVSAFALRQTLGLIREDNTCFRLVHGEGDFLPGLVIDIYGDTAVMQAHSPGMHFARICSRSHLKDHCIASRIMQFIELFTYIFLGLFSSLVLPLRLSDHMEPSAAKFAFRILELRSRRDRAPHDHRQNCNYNIDNISLHLS